MGIPIGTHRRCLSERPLVFFSRLTTSTTLQNRRFKQISLAQNNTTSSQTYESDSENTKYTPEYLSGRPNLEKLRRELEQSKNQPPFTITRTVEWLSKTANSGNGFSLAFPAFRWVLGMDQPPSWRRPRDFDSIALLKLEEETDPAIIHTLTIALLIPRTAALKLIFRCPEAARINPSDLMTRLVSIKDALPGCDVARMVELVPTAFLSSPLDETIHQIQQSSSLLREGLSGADIDSMFESDPTILFESPESLETGLARMKELWGDLTISMLAASEPEELALAVRALGLKGPPKSL